jgi:hypothetical protein
MFFRMTFKDNSDIKSELKTLYFYLIFNFIPFIFYFIFVNNKTKSFKKIKHQSNITFFFFDIVIIP